MHNSPTLHAAIETHLLPFVQRPLRYVGNELNIVRKDLASVALRGVFCFPDLYDVGMSHFGLQILYHIINSHDRWALSRCFHPWSDAEAILRKQRIPLFDLEYCKGLGSADWLGFSLQYELQFTNVLNMLSLGHIPLRSSDRTADHPIVLAGGPCVANPEPLSPFMDAILIGDGEEALVKVCELLEESKEQGQDRKRLLEHLSNIPGVYVPSNYEPERSDAFVVPRMPDAAVKAAKVRTLEDAFYPEKPLVPLIDVVHHRLAVEVMRGCTRGCRFCSAGTFYRPVRERSVNAIHKTIAEGIAASGWREVGLLSLSTADYRGLTPLLKTARQLKEQYRFSLSLPSTRIDSLSDEQFESLWSVSHHSSFTVAPEAGSERLRAVINKGFSDEQIFQMARTLFDRNVRTLKLYFMIGLPTETQEDIDALVRMVQHVAGIARSTKGKRMVHVSASPFSPKPHTPFQWESMASGEYIHDVNGYLRESFRPIKNVKFSYRNPEITALETILARGDREVADLIERAWKQGARMDGWDEFFDYSRWKTAAEAIGSDLQRYTDEIPEHQQLPWHGVSTGVTREFLQNERSKSRAAQLTEDCREGRCTLCGACEVPKEGLCSIVDAVTAQQSDQAHPRLLSAQERYFYRVTYHKGEAIRFLGHMDMVNAIHRAFVAAGIPVEYSRGFSPHPKMSFGPPLPLGASGERELFDLVTSAPLEDRWTEANRYLPDELNLIGARPHEKKPQAISAQISAARFRFRPLVSLPPELIEQRIDSARNRDSLVISFVKSGEEHTKDIAPLILSLVNRPEEACFEAVLLAQPGKTCRPRDLLSALFPDHAENELVITRCECLETGPQGLVPLR